MATNTQYDQEFKVQAVKLAQEIGQAKAASELGISKTPCTRGTVRTVWDILILDTAHKHP